MSTMDAQLKKYYRAIKREMLCPGDTKARICKDIENDINAYLQENPDADFPAIEAHFGSPRQICAAYVEEMPTPELMKKLKIRKRITVSVCATVLVAAIAAVTIWAVAVASAYKENSDISAGYIKEGEIVIEQINIEEEEDSN